MIRLTLIGSGVVLGLAAWLSAAGEPATDAFDLRPAATADSTTGELTPAMIGRCMAVAREVDPELATRLDRIRRDRSEADFRRAMSQARHLLGLARLKEEDPKLYGVKVAELQLQAQVDRLMSRLIDARRASSPSAADIEVELQNLVKAQVGYSLIARGMYLRSLEKHVKSLRDELDHDLQPVNFGPAVQRRYQVLLDRVSAAVGSD